MTSNVNRYQLLSAHGRLAPEMSSYKHYLILSVKMTLRKKLIFVSHDEKTEACRSGVTCHSSQLIGGEKGENPGLSQRWPVGDPCANLRPIHLAHSVFVKIFK